MNVESDFTKNDGMEPIDNPQGDDESSDPGSGDDRFTVAPKEKEISDDATIKSKGIANIEKAPEKDQEMTNEEKQDVSSVEPKQDTPEAQPAGEEGKFKYFHITLTNLDEGSQRVTPDFKPATPPRKTDNLTPKRSLKETIEAIENKKFEEE